MEKWYIGGCLSFSAAIAGMTGLSIGTENRFRFVPDVRAN